MKLAEVNPLAGMIAFALLAMAPTYATADEVRLRAALEGSAVDPGAFGRAEFEAGPDRARLRVEAEDVASTDALDVFVNGEFVGTIALDGRGRGRLELESRAGDTIPAIQAGDEIDLLDANDDATIVLSGTFS